MEFTELEEQILSLLEEISAKVEQLPPNRDDITLITHHLSKLERIIMTRAVSAETAKRLRWTK